MAKSPTFVKDRQELFILLDAVMNKTYFQVRDFAPFEPDHAQVKTYLLEFDWERQKNVKEEIAFLATSLTIPPSRTGKSCVPRITQTSEIGFYCVQWEWRNDTPIIVFLDSATDQKRRFWIAYSLSDAKTLDIIFDRLAMNQPAFDRVWFWPKLLSDTQSRGDFRGIGIDYDYRRFELNSQRPDSTDYLKMQIRGGSHTQLIYQQLQESSAFSQQIVLAKVGLKYWVDRDDLSNFAVEEIKYNGKFTTKGTSFADHQSLVIDMRATYANKIRSIEANHTIMTSNASNYGVDGDPVIFSFEKRPIEDLDHFCSVVFSGRMPFRLWGLSRRAAGTDDGRQITAVDLHTGSKLFFEVFPDMVSMYLYPGACGNTVARFFTNIQQTFSRQVTCEDTNEQRLF